MGGRSVLIPVTCAHYIDNLVSLCSNVRKNPSYSSFSSVFKRLFICSARRCSLLLCKIENCVCVVDAESLLLLRMFCSSFFLSSHFTFPPTFTFAILTFVETSAIDVKPQHKVQDGLDSRYDIFLEI